MTVFVTSATSTTGNLGGLSGADATCQRLAAAVDAGGRTWRAYLSVERDPANGNRPTDARSRIGDGPWVNANGITVANSLAELHARTGHSDGFGGGGSTTVTPTNNVISWNSAHTSAGCANTAPGGGAGRFYCFAR